jgi:hypothetical protein
MRGYGLHVAVVLFLAVRGGGKIIKGGNRP